MFGSLIKGPFSLFSLLHIVCKAVGLAFKVLNMLEREA
jgi:hypothetical protein